MTLSSISCTLLKNQGVRSSIAAGDALSRTWSSQRTFTHKPTSSLASVRSRPSDRQAFIETAAALAASALTPWLPEPLSHGYRAPP